MTQTKAELLETKHQGDIRLGDANSSHYVGLKAPATVSSNLVWTLPATDGSSNQFLKTDGSGNLSWATDSATDSTKMPLAGGIFTGNVTYNDNVEARFGTGADFKIYHDGTDNYFQTGALTTHFRVNSGNRLTLKSDGNVQMQGSSGKNFEWKTTGILSLADNAKAVFGTGSDFELYHDGSHSYITNTLGDLKITTSSGMILATNSLRLKNNASNETYVAADVNAGVELYYDNVKKFETTSAGVDITGTLQTDVLTIYDSTTPWITVGYQSGQDHRIQWDSSKLQIKADPNNDGNNSQIILNVDGSDKLILNKDGEFGIGGTNYGTSGQVLTSGGTGSAASWADAAGGGATPTVKTANYTAASGDMVVVNGTGLTITLPSSPSTGDSVAIRILGDRYATVARNGSNIESSATNYYVDIFDGYATFTYSDSTRGWLIGG